MGLLFKLYDFRWELIGVGINLTMIFGRGLETRSSRSFIDEEYPYFGSGDTDGNHCYNCEEDFVLQNKGNWGHFHK